MGGGGGGRFVLHFFINILASRASFLVSYFLGGGGE